MQTGQVQKEKHTFKIAMSSLILIKIYTYPANTIEHISNL